LRRGSLCRLFSEGYMCSPVSRMALGECNAIRSPGIRASRVDFCSTSETEVGNRHYLSPFCATDGRSGLNPSPYSVSTG